MHMASAIYAGSRDDLPSMAVLQCCLARKELGVDYFLAFVFKS